MLCVSLVDIGLELTKLFEFEVFLKSPYGRNAGSKMPG